WVVSATSCPPTRSTRILHSVPPLVKRTSTRVGPLSCTSGVNPAAGALDASEIVSPLRCTAIDPPGDEYVVSVAGGRGGAPGAAGGSGVATVPAAGDASLAAGVAAGGGTVPLSSGLPPGSAGAVPVARGSPVAPVEAGAPVVAGATGACEAGGTFTRRS